MRAACASREALAFSLALHPSTELTSSVAGRTEAAIMEAMAPLACDRTALVVAHRFSTLKKFASLTRGQ
jgi:ABC-type transport system involved in Fe-S cluster assembly fused permease/ATPase subunit